MRPIRPDVPRNRGVTLIELVVAMVITSIVVAATVYFFFPVVQSTDVSGRAELTDIADNALQRIGRETRLALPNSVRTATVGSQRFLEFLPIRAAGRYRGDAGGTSGGVDCTVDPGGPAAPASDQLSFDGIVDTCFKTIGMIGTASEVASITTSDFLVFNNYGPGFSGQNAYATNPPTAGALLNRRKISSVANEGTRVRFGFASADALDRVLHDSPGKRFFVVIGNAGTVLPEAVSYVCDPSVGTLVRRWGYAMTAAQPTSFSTGSSAQIASNVSGCEFDYTANVAPQIGLLTMRLTLSKVLSGSTQTISLYHSVHVSNLP